MIIDLEDAKDHLRVEFDDQDRLIAGKIKAAEAWIEDAIGVSLVVTFPNGAPEPLKEAARQIVAAMYQGGDDAAAKSAAVDLVRPYRTWSF